jgi:hypothetical protein
MSTPPDPGIPALLLLAAAKLRFLVKVRDPLFGELGVLAEGDRERPLYVIGVGGDRAAWSLDGGPRLDPHLMTRATFELLASATQREDGSLVSRDRAYQLHSRWSASGMVAEAVALERAAA